MKTQLIKIVLTSCLCFSLSLGLSQESQNAAGGEASGSGGTVSYSVGQLVYTTAIGTTGSVAQGVQHAFDIYAVGIEDQVWDFKVAVYPNPTSNKVNLSIENYPAKQLSYQLYDLQGKLLAKDVILPQTTEIEFSSLAAAVYFLKVMQENQQLKSFKIVKN
ncbi:MAG: T9SS type A sorting domain-containing protein [Bacteroidia bacterium]